MAPTTAAPGSKGSHKAQQQAQHLVGAGGVAGAGGKAYVSHDVTNFEFLYEPFYVARDVAPPHDERFMGYGYTRNTQVGFTFLKLRVNCGARNEFHGLSRTVSPARKSPTPPGDRLRIIFWRYLASSPSLPPLSHPLRSAWGVSS